MLYLLFQLGPDRYALPAGQVEEVLPCLNLKLLPQAQPGVAGAFNYRGRPVPVIDLQQMAFAQAAEPWLSTRLILVRYPLGDDTTRLLGLIAGRVTETVRLEDKDFEPIGVAMPSARYLGPVARDAQGLVQRVEIAELLAPELRAVLFTQAEEVVT